MNDATDDKVRGCIVGVGVNAVTIKYRCCCSMGGWWEENKNVDSDNKGSCDIRWTVVL